MIHKIVQAASSPALAKNARTGHPFPDWEREKRKGRATRPSWGDDGFGYLPYDVFTKSCIECWAELFGGQAKWSQPESGVAHRIWGIREFTGDFVHGHEIMGSDDTRIGWAYAVEREDGIEVEELFVMPRFRRKQYGRALVKTMGTLAQQKGEHLKFWVPHVDAGQENMLAATHLLAPLGLNAQRSPWSWASYVFK